MRNTINTCTNVVVLGNRQDRVVVAGTDRLRGFADAHRLASRHSASSAVVLSGSASALLAGKPMAKPAAAMRRAACARRAAACYAGRWAGIPARQQWQRSRRLPPAAVSRS